VSRRALERLPGGRRLRDGRHLYWWLEIAALVVFYVVYSAIRNANEGDASTAFTNARRIMDLERSIGLLHEETIQDWALHWKPTIVAANYFYGSLHFVVTIGAALFLFVRFADDYPRYRNTLGFTTAIALVGFITFPLMPPRLLEESYGFVDTLAKYPTIWSFNSGAVSKISNQYAAMPSVHIAWALWCSFVLVPRLRATWARVAAAGYPLVTVAVIVVTGNHFVLDAAGGAIVLGVGFLLANRVTRAGRGAPRPEPAGAAAADPARA
jgi:hypothetical protein